MLERGFIIIKDDNYLVSLIGDQPHWHRTKSFDETCIINPLILEDESIALYIAKTLKAQAVWTTRSREYII